MFNRSLTFEQKRFACEKGLFKKVVTYKLCENADFGNGGYQYSNRHPACTEERFFQYVYCLGYMTRLAISRCKNRSRNILRCEENQ